MWLQDQVLGGGDHDIMATTVIMGMHITVTDIIEDMVVTGIKSLYGISYNRRFGI